MSKVVVIRTNDPNQVFSFGDDEEFQQPEDEGESVLEMLQKALWCGFVLVCCYFVWHTFKSHYTADEVPTQSSDPAAVVDTEAAIKAKRKRLEEYFDSNPLHMILANESFQISRSEETRACSHDADEEGFKHGENYDVELANTSKSEREVIRASSVDTDEEGVKHGGNHDVELANSSQSKKEVLRTCSNDGNEAVVMYGNNHDLQMADRFVSLDVGGERSRRIVASDFAVCLETFTEGDSIVWSASPDCRHIFHRECILNGLSQVPKNETPCPCCRINFCLLIDDKKVEESPPTMQDTSTEEV